MQRAHDDGFFLVLLLTLIISLGESVLSGLSTAVTTTPSINASQNNSPLGDHQEQRGDSRGSGGKEKRKVEEKAKKGEKKKGR